MTHHLVLISDDESNTGCIVNDDYFPSVQVLFQRFNSLYFEGKLGNVSIEWSFKMTLCAGLCYYFKKSHSCSIKLSEPILKFRPLEDLIDTLLHEMIHAYLFIVAGSTDRDGHGPDFQKLMSAINIVAGSNITIYHSFYEEINYYKKHIWRCSGPCKDKPPFYGWVRRSMNRPPQVADFWFSDHEQTCGGTFVKFSELTKDNEPGNKNTTSITIQPNNRSLESSLTSRVLGTNGQLPIERVRQLTNTTFSGSNYGFTFSKKIGPECDKEVLNLPFGNDLYVISDSDEN